MAGKEKVSQLHDLRRLKTLEKLTRLFRSQAPSSQTVETPAHHVIPPAPPVGFQSPRIRKVQSARVFDITPRPPVDEDACRKRLTSYEVYTIRKIVPQSPGERPTWAKAEISREASSQEDILKTIKTLGERMIERRRTVQEKKAALMPFQQGQINRLIDELVNSDPDTNFQWSLVQLDSKVFINKKGLNETRSITVYVKWQPLAYINAAGLYNAIERNKRYRFDQMNRAPPPPAPHIPREARARPPSVRSGQRSKAEQQRYDGQSDSYSSLSDIESISTTDPRQGSVRSRSQFRTRDRDSSRHPSSANHQLDDNDRHDSFMAEFPLRGFDPVAAAYQAGKIDADAERFAPTIFNTKSRLQ
jgi:hypothetical protein